MPTAPSSTDTSLIVRVQAKDAQGWQELVELYAPWIFAWTRRLGLSATDGADITQDTLLAACRGIAQFRRRSVSDSFRGWLWTILRNKIRDFHRRVRADAAAGGTHAQLQLLAVPDALPDESLDLLPSNDLIPLLHRGLAQVKGEFEERTWNAFWKVVVEGRTAVEVSRDLGISPNAVRQAKSRILRRLRAQLGDSPDRGS